MITEQRLRWFTRIWVATMSAGMVMACAASARAQVSPSSTGVAIATTAAPPEHLATTDAQARPADTPPTTAKAQSGSTGLKRWVDFQTGTVAARYRYIETSTGVVASNHLQGQTVVKGRFKFDRGARFSVNALAASGSAFTVGWNNTGWGTGDRSWKFSVKHLFVAVVPVKGVEAALGSFAPVRGESTEITTFDNDAYLMGERVTVKRPKDLYFDEIGFTSAYLGDVLDTQRLRERRPPDRFAQLLPVLRRQAFQQALRGIR